MSGTNELNLTILHDTKVHLTTANGFAPNPDEGANNVLIEERASLMFIEKSHQRIPMWTIYGTLTMKEDSELQVINSRTIPSSITTISTSLLQNKLPICRNIRSTSSKTTISHTIMRSNRKVPITQNRKR